MSKTCAAVTMKNPSSERAHAVETDPPPLLSLILTISSNFNAVNAAGSNANVRCKAGPW
jgi:hypothetical protein